MAARLKIKTLLLKIILFLIFAGSMLLFLASIWPQPESSRIIPFPAIHMEEFQPRTDLLSND